MAAAGLQTTSEGLPKYLDFLDCTGDGDIDTSQIVSLLDKETNTTQTEITGKSGKTLQLGTWAQNLTEVRLGGIRLYDAVPRSVAARLQRERKAQFIQQHRPLLAATQWQLDD